MAIDEPPLMSQLVSFVEESDHPLTLQSSVIFLTNYIRQTDTVIAIVNHLSMSIYRPQERLLINVRTGEIQRKQFPDHACYVCEVLDGGQYLIVRNHEQLIALETEYLLPVWSWSYRPSLSVIRIFPVGSTSFVVSDNSGTIGFINLETHMVNHMRHSPGDSLVGQHDYLFITRVTTGELEIYESHSGRLMNRIPHFGHGLSSCTRQPMIPKHIPIE